MNRLVVIIATILVPTGYSAAEVLWCYHDPSCNDTTWSTIASEHCNGSHQSPINIISASAVGDTNLTEFNFTKYRDNSTMKNITNTGETVKVKLTSGVQVKGGALSEAYDSLQFHLHWGNGTSVPGSEHTVDGTRYPMELHIVNSKSSLNGSTTVAVADSTGLAALGFFIEAMTGNATGSPPAWKTLTSYLANITLKDDIVNITHAISLDELLEGVDRTKYYRYLGSLTTPNCSEAVVWTVFKDPIRVSQDLTNIGSGMARTEELSDFQRGTVIGCHLSNKPVRKIFALLELPRYTIDLFSTTLHIDHNSTSALMTNVFRNIQPVNGRMVTTQGSPTTAPPVSGASTKCSSLGLMALAWMLLRV